MGFGGHLFSLKTQIMSVRIIFPISYQKIYYYLNFGYIILIDVALVRPNKISVFPVLGLKILGWVGTHIFFTRKKYNFMHFEVPFKMHKIIFFPKT